VIGVFVWAWLVRSVVGDFNGFAGGVALAIVVVPIVTRNVEETLRLVPDPLREASSCRTSTSRIRDLTALSMSR